MWQMMNNVHIINSCPRTKPQQQHLPISNSSLLALAVASASAVQHALSLYKLPLMLFHCLYTVNHKKRGSLFLAITLAILNQFL